MSHKGSGLEAAVIASQLRAVRLTQVRQEAKWVGGNRCIPQKGPCDFFGTVVATGRSIIFDAKVCADEKRLVAKEDHLSSRQRTELIIHGEAGAISGILAESTHLGRFFWLRWRALRDNAASYRWDHPDMVDVGDARRLIDWGRVVEAAGVGVNPENP